MLAKVNRNDLICVFQDRIDHNDLKIISRLVKAVRVEIKS